ncbi:MAG: ABC transporter ATP-binding protein [Pseudomonadota bacterium]
MTEHKVPDSADRGLRLERVSVPGGTDNPPSAPAGRRREHRLSDVSLAVEPGELFGLIGPNGAGKSTLLKTIAQLIAYRGNVRFRGRRLNQLDAHSRARQIAYLAQGGQSAWPLSVWDFVMLGRIPYQRGGWRRRSVSAGTLTGPDTDREAVSTALAHTELEALAARPVGSLSGGEFARVRLARALAVQAPLLLADEPVAALDPYHQLRLMDLLRVQCEQGKSAIVVLHDLTLASRFCDRLLLLHEGEAVACDVPRRVLTPAHLQRVYQVEAVVGEHGRQPYIVPWSCNRPAGEGQQSPDDQRFSLNWQET